jgi:hypothetical protein
MGYSVICTCLAYQPVDGQQGLESGLAGRIQKDLEE